MLDQANGPSVQHAVPHSGQNPGAIQRSHCCSSSTKNAEHHWPRHSVSMKIILQLIYDTSIWILQDSKNLDNPNILQKPRHLGWVAQRLELVQGLTEAKALLHVLKYRLKVIFSTFTRCNK